MSTNQLIIIWPILILFAGFIFHKLQNSKVAWSGGPISFPKSVWLAFAVLTWFFMPLLFLFNKNFEISLSYIFIFHLFSWWIRGLLELLMIYKFYNWSPKYGIIHDLFHISAIIILCFFPRNIIVNISFSNNFNIISMIFVFTIIISTVAEAYFAYLFLNTRSEIERKENIYFASEDAKWQYINKVTKIALVTVFILLLLQSLLIIWS